MSDGDALLAAIIAQPGGDTPRLMYADVLDAIDSVRVKCPKCKGTGWMDAADPASGRTTGEFQTTCNRCHGEREVLDTSNRDRAEFIRVQCELARLQAEAARVEAREPKGESEEWIAEYRKKAHEAQRDIGLLFQREWPCGCILCLRKLEPVLREREQMLLAEPRHFVNWTPSVMHTGSGAGIRYETGGKVGLLGKGFEEAEFHRGFISSLTCTFLTWIAHADEIRKEHPVERVELTTTPTGNQLRDECWRKPGLVEKVDVVPAHLILGGLFPHITFKLPP